jgi:acyl-CoA synthetase (AMP-forming)/AMP-acid ligase II
MLSGHLCDYLKHIASVHLVPEKLGNNPKALAHFIARREFTVWYSTPTIRAPLADFGNLKPRDPALALDSDFRPVERGEKGLLFISGEPVFLGYWGRDEESAGRYVMRDGMPWYNTSDVVIERPEAGFTYGQALIRSFQPVEQA